MSKTLGFIGSGNIGSALARLAVAAGLRVVVSNSRGPQSLSLVAELGEGATAATVAEAAQVADLVVAAIPLGAYENLPADALAGKTVIDTMVYYPGRDGHIEELDAGTLTSSALVQRHLADSQVIKAFNNVDFHRLFSLARPAGAPDRSGLPMAGDDAAAKEQVAQLHDLLGYDAVDIGNLADTWRNGPNTPIHVQPYLGIPAETLSSDEERWRWFLQTPGTPVPADQVKALIDAAVTGPAGGVYPGAA